MTPLNALKSLLFLILVAGLGAGYIPFALLPRDPQVETGALAYLAFPLWLLGAVTILRCFSDFAFKGHGTPIQLTPQKSQWQQGYITTFVTRFIQVLLTIIIGHFLWFKTIWMLAYAVVVFLVFHLFVIFYEEPTLKEKFGATYTNYCKSTPRWIPKICGQTTKD